MKKILCITNVYPWEKGGRAEKLATRLNALKKNNWQIDLFVISSPAKYNDLIRSYFKLVKKARNYDVIWTMNNPWHLHILGLLLPGKSKWLAEFRDPWSENPYYKRRKLKKKIHRFMEDIVAQKAKVVVLKNINQLAYFKDKGVDVEELPHFGNKKNSMKETRITFPSDIFNIIYAGRFYKKWIEPEQFFYGLHLFINDPKGSTQIQALFYGDWNEEYDNLLSSINLENKVKHFSWVTHDEITAIMESADLLLAIEDKNIISSKFFDYANSSTPILALTENPKIIEMIEKNKLGYYCRNDPYEIKDKLLQIYDDYQNERIVVNRFPFSREEHDKAFARICDDLIAKRSE